MVNDLLAKNAELNSLFSSLTPLEFQWAQEDALVKEVRSSLSLDNIPCDFKSAFEAIHIFHGGLGEVGALSSNYLLIADGVTFPLKELEDVRRLYDFLMRISLNKVERPDTALFRNKPHGLGTVLTLIFGPFLLIKAAKTGDSWSIVACSIFVFALLCLYTFSCLYHGLLSKPLPCRMERHHNIVLDGAHNPEAVEALMNSLVPMAEGKPIHVVFASLRDKNIAVELPRIDRDVAEIVLTTFPSERARNEEDYFLYEGDYSFNPDYKEVITNFLVKYPDDYILITGSLAFAALAKKYVEDELRL